MNILGCAFLGNRSNLLHKSEVWDKVNTVLGTPTQMNETEMKKTIEIYLVLFGRNTKFLVFVFS